MHAAGRSGMTFGEGTPGNDTKEGGAVNEDRVNSDVRILRSDPGSFQHLQFTSSHSTWTDSQHIRADHCHDIGCKVPAIHPPDCCTADMQQQSITL